MRLTAPSVLPAFRTPRYLRVYRNRFAARSPCSLFTPRIVLIASHRSTSSQSEPESKHGSTKHKSGGPARLTVVVASLGLLAGLASYNWTAIASTMPFLDSSANQLDPNRFCFYKLASKLPVSSTSSVFCLENESMKRANPELERLWEEGVWSIEIKQPEIMIVRSYTPLPPILSSDHGRSSITLERLQFLIRKERQGEVSGYLHRLPQSASVEMRGPYLEYKLPDDISEVVFIAGGTGIAPAMQVAYALAQRPRGSTQLKLLWANRTREDIYGSSPSTREQSMIDQLEQLQASFHNHMSMKLFVDEDKSFVTKNDIKSVLHSQESPPTPRAGRKLVLISGPDGFVEYVAGAKRLINGQETQGEIGGLLAQSDLTEWEVWKL